MSLRKCQDLSYSTHFLKSRDSVIRIHFLNKEQTTLLRDENREY